MHHDPGFLPWHRAYLLSFENAMRQIPGCGSITLPFWDITQLAPDWLFAEPFASYPYPADLGAGYSKGDITTRNDASAIQAKMKASGVYTYIFNSTKTGWWDDYNGYWSRAAYTTIIAAHDNGHNSTGSTMSDQSVASFDPIFWFFHCNWDRLWWVWQNAVQATSQNGINQVIRKSTDRTSYALFNSTDEVAKLPPFPQLAVDTIDSAGSLDVGYGSPAVPPTAAVPAIRSMAVMTDENGTVDTDQVIVSVKGVNRLKIPGSFNVHLLKDGKPIATSGFFQPAEPEKCATCVRNAYAHFEFDFPLAAITGGKLSVEFEPLQRDLVGTRISPQAIDNPTIEVQYPLRTE